MIYLDNAASSYPKPQSVIKGVCKFISVNGANPGRSGHKLSVSAADLVFKTRYNLAQMFGIEEAENIAFVPNATYGINMILMGCLKKGDHVVTTELEHNSVLRPLERLRAMNEIEYDVAPVDLYDDSVTINNILGLLRSNTTAVVCTQCSNVCGKVMPIKRLSKVLPDDVALIVDGSQGAGIIKTDIVADGIDYYCAPSHKGLLGLQGSGFVAINSCLPKAVITGGSGSESDSLIHPSYMPDLLESGTVATPSIVSMNYGIEFIRNMGIDAIYNHKKQLGIYLYHQLKQIDDVVLYTDVERGDFIGVFSFNIKGVYSDEVAEYLSINDICVRSGLHCAPFAHKMLKTEKTGAVRVSFSCFNDKNDIDRLIKIINKYIKIKK